MNFPTYNGMQNPGIYPQPQPIPNYAPNPTTSPLMNQNMAQSPFNWVQGEAGAKAYPVAPNAVVELWDSESDTIYIKSADRTGMPSIKVLDYRVRNEAHNGSNSVLNTSSEEIITRKDLEELKDEIEALKGQIAKIKPCKCSNESHKRENNLVKGGNGGNKR